MASISWLLIGQFPIWFANNYFLASDWSIFRASPIFDQSEARIRQTDAEFRQIIQFNFKLQTRKMKVVFNFLNSLKKKFRRFLKQKKEDKTNSFSPPPEIFRIQDLNIIDEWYKNRPAKVHFAPMTFTVTYYPHDTPREFLEEKITRLRSPTARDTRGKVKRLRLR